MPVMDGWALIEKLKADASLSEIPVIALTAHALKADRERAIAAGFFNYLPSRCVPPHLWKSCSYYWLMFPNLLLN